MGLSLLMTRVWLLARRRTLAAAWMQGMINARRDCLQRSAVAPGLVSRSQFAAPHPGDWGRCAGPSRTALIRSAKLTWNDGLHMLLFRLPAVGHRLLPARFQPITQHRSRLTRPYLPGRGIGPSRLNSIPSPLARHLGTIFIEEAMDWITRDPRPEPFAARSASAAPAVPLSRQRSANRPGCASISTLIEP